MSSTDGGAGAAAVDKQDGASRLLVEGSVVDINSYFYEQGWTDGLPVIPPTEDLVLHMIEACSLPGNRILGRMPPLNGTVTAEKVAINTVMAGCKPDYMPVVLAAVKAVLQPQFNVGSITTTTGGAAPLLIVSGPIANQLGIHGGTGVFGSGHQANATIGRALRLTMRNMGGAKADTMEKSTHGWPGKYTMCFAENQEANPWEPLHVDLGYPAEVSTVTVSAARGIHTMVEATRETGEGVLETLVDSMTAGGISGYSYQARGASPGVVLGPEHAATIANDGFSKADTVEWLRQRALIPLERYTNDTLLERYREIPGGPIPMVRDPEDLLVIVLGSPGKHSSWIPTFGGTTRSVTREIVAGI